MAATRTARAHWEGSLLEGAGQVTLESSGVGTFDVSWPARTEQANGKTSPEELLGAAHSTCYSMSVSNVLTEAHPGDRFGMRGRRTVRDLSQGIGHLIVHREDLAERDTERHQPGQVVPDGLPGGRPDLPTGPERVDAMPEKHLAPIDVAHPGKHGLVHQQLANRLGTAHDPTQSKIRVGVWPQGVGAESSLDLVDLLGRDNRTHGRRPQVPHPGVVQQPEPDLPLDRDVTVRHTSFLRMRVGTHPRTRIDEVTHDGELADQPEVDVEPSLALELDEQVLPPGRRANHRQVVKQGGAVLEPALRAGDGNLRPGEGAVEACGQRVRGVTFGHRLAGLA